MRTTLAVVASLFLSVNVQAELSSIVTDNFNSYLNGPVVGQGGWFDRENGSSWVVQDSVVNEGAKALLSNYQSSDSVITKTAGVSLSDGRQSFYVRIVNRAGWGDYDIGENFQLGLFQESWDGPARATLAFMKDGQIASIDEQLGVYVGFDTYMDNAWNLVTAEWRQDAVIRYQVNGDVWTDWKPFHGSQSFTGFNTVGFVSFYMGSGEVYVDTLGEIPSPTTLAMFGLGSLASVRRRRR